MATGGTQLYRYLQQRLPDMITKRYEDLPYDAGLRVASDVNLQAGAQEVVAEVLNSVGDAQVVSDGAFDFPIVDLSLSEDRYKVLMVGSAMSWTFQQERSMSFAGNLTQMNSQRENTVTRSIAERRNKIAAYGESRLGITGFLNHPSVTLVNSSFNFYSPTITPDEMYTFFLDQIKAFDNSSNNVLTPSQATVSTDLYYKLSQRLGDTQVTVKAFIEEMLSADGIQFKIHKDKWSNSALLEANGVQSSGTNKDRITFFNIGRDIASRMVEPTAMMPMDYVAVKNGRKVFPFFSCVTPVMIHQIPSFRYIDVPKAA